MGHYQDWGELLTRARQHPHGRIDGAHHNTLRALVSRGWAYQTAEGEHCLTQEGWAGNRPPELVSIRAARPTGPPLNADGTPSRFYGTPQQWHQYLLTICAEDTLLRFYQWVGSAGVREAIDNVLREQDRFDMKMRLAHGGMSQLQKSHAKAVTGAMEYIDPARSGGPYPSSLAVVTHQADRA